MSEPRPPQSAQIASTWWSRASRTDVGGRHEVVARSRARCRARAALEVRIELERFVLATVTAYETVPLFEVAVHVLAAFATESAPVAVFVHVMFVFVQPAR
jgi:hypothetical protein